MRKGGRGRQLSKCLGEIIYKYHCWFCTINWLNELEEENGVEQNIQIPIVQLELKESEYFVYHILKVVAI